MAYTNIDDPSAYFQVKTYTGNSGVQFVTNDGNSDLQPDWVWIKNRTVGYSHQLYDSSRGTTKALFSDLTNAETTISNGLLTFNTDGFGVNSAAAVNENELVAWQWKANGGTTASNTDGSVTSTVQVNQDAGFSIVTWTTGVGSGNHSVGHGLGVKPAMFITKSRGGTSFWTLWHQGMAGDTSYIRLDATTAEQTFSDVWGDGITSSVFGYNYPATVYANQPYIAYCFAEKQGYSKFGSYVGNGNVNGPMVYLGFKPAVIILKRSDSTTGGNWHIIDNKRSASGGANVNVYSLFPNLSAAESTGEAESTYGIDFLSNGFKLRASHSTRNALGGTYIYMAFAENPFVTSTGIPTTAR